MASHPKQDSIPQKSFHMFFNREHIFVDLVSIEYNIALLLAHVSLVDTKFIVDFINVVKTKDI